MEGMVTALAVLACPLGMGLMMLFMMKGMRGGKETRAESSLDELRAEQRHVASEIERHRRD